MSTKNGLTLNGSAIVVELKRRGGRSSAKGVPASGGGAVGAASSGGAAAGGAGRRRTAGDDDADDADADVTVWVGGLGEAATEASVQAIFAGCGAIKSVSVKGRDKKWANVVFNAPAAVVKAIALSGNNGIKVEAPKPKLRRS